MSIILFLIILVALILVHEFGHFIVAKASKVRVDEFGIGFPPKLWGKKIGETEYTVNALPFGGFVRIFGEDPNQESIEGPEHERSFVHRPTHVKALVIVAGVVMNVVFAYALFVVGLMLGMPTGISPDDASKYPNASLIISSVMPSSPAEAVALKPGDIITSISRGGESVDVLDPANVSAFIAASSEPVSLTISRGSDTITVDAAPKAGLLAAVPERKILGFALGLIATVPLSFSEALVSAYFLTGSMLTEITVSLVGFVVSAFTLSADFSQVAGPVGIVSLVGDASAIGITALISFTALISLNLAVVNMLPFPALDGGRFVLILVEAVKGSRINPQFANALNGIGFILLLALMAAVTASDIFKLL